ncbi:MAG: hypothetical protein K8H87_13060 [Pseudorhodoplanes sp.]|nr:hypothetical protein [Pseudorhodoplanes sp.]
MTSVEIRVIGPTGIEDHHAHLLRLDRSQRVLPTASGTDDRGIDGHCLRLIGSQAILIGAYADGVLRAGLEIIPDRTARQADVVFTAEKDHATPAIVHMLIARMFDEARRYRLTGLAIYGFGDEALLGGVAAANGAKLERGMPMRVRFAPALARAAGCAGEPALSYGHA